MITGDDITISFEEQLAAGDALFSEHLFPAQPDWGAIKDEIPEDDESAEEPAEAGTTEP